LVSQFKGAQLATRNSTCRSENGEKRLFLREGCIVPLLAVDLFVRGDLIEQLSSRQPMISNPVIMGAVQELYVGRETGHLRRGTAGKVGGSPRRLVQVLDQLNLTFDLRASSPSRVVSLLPKEFDRWKSA
jgi:hypothetical protein